MLPLEFEFSILQPAFVPRLSCLAQCIVPSALCPCWRRASSQHVVGTTIFLGKEGVNLCCSKHTILLLGQKRKFRISFTCVHTVLLIFAAPLALLTYWELIWYSVPLAHPVSCAIFDLCQTLHEVLPLLFCMGHSFIVECTIYIYSLDTFFHLSEFEYKY